MMKNILGIILTLSTACFLNTSVVSAQDEGTPAWHFGIGTGLKFANAKGDQGLHTNLAGPVLADVDLDPDDFGDLIQTAIGFGGYATNGKLMVQYMLVQIKMGGEPSGTLPSGATFTSDLSFDVTTGQLTVGYTAFRKGKISVQPFVGFRYMKHKLGADVTVAATPVINRSIKNNWTDVLFGTALNVTFLPKLNWSTSIDGGFGGSNGTFNFTSGISWRLLKFMSIGPNFSFMAIDYENGKMGDTDWYIYDVNEFGWGISLMFHIK